MEDIKQYASNRGLWLWRFKHPALCMELVQVNLLALNSALVLAGGHPWLVKTMRARCLAYARAGYPIDLVESRVAADLHATIRADGDVGASTPLPPPPRATTALHGTMPPPLTALLRLRRSGGVVKGDSIL